AVSETKAGPNNSTVATTAEFHTVTSVTVDGAVGTSVSLGSGTTGTTAWFIVDTFATPTDISIYVAITSTINYTVQQTPDDPNATASPTTFNDLNLASVTTAGSTAYGAPCGGIRAIVNSSSGNGALVLTISQARK